MTGRIAPPGAQLLHRLPLPGEGHAAVALCIAACTVVLTTHTSGSRRQRQPRRRFANCDGCMLYDVRSLPCLPHLASCSAGLSTIDRHRTAAPTARRSPGCSRASMHHVGCVGRSLGWWRLLPRARDEGRAWMCTCDCGPGRLRSDSKKLWESPRRQRRRMRGAQLAWHGASAIINPLSCDDHQGCSLARYATM